MIILLMVDVAVILAFLKTRNHVFACLFKNDIVASEVLQKHLALEGDTRQLHKEEVNGRGEGKRRA